MNANGYVSRLAEKAFNRQLEKANIRRSLEGLRSRIDVHFSDASRSGNTVKEHFAFGSYTRGTMLPRSMDLLSDIDYMIVFKDSDAKPQAYLDRLRRFATTHYKNSDIVQSNPTIVLTLNHIRFELVPAIDSFWSGLKIPTRGDGYQSWMSTNPNEFNSKLTEKNKGNQNLIKPLIRLMKYWNACNNYPFESYKLEQEIVGHSSLKISFFGGDLWTRFVNYIENMSTFGESSDHKNKAISRAKSLLREIQKHESRNEDTLAQNKLQCLLPPIR